MDTGATILEEDALKKVAGSWEGEETGDELNAMIRNSRYDNPREIKLCS